MTSLADDGDQPPRPDPGFRWVARSWGPTLECPALGAVARHCFTTRGLELRRDHSDGVGAWSRLAAAVGVGSECLIRTVQVHGRDVHVVTAGTRFNRLVWPVADAIIATEASDAVAVVAADCVPILLADRRLGAVAAVHAGWRGTAAGVAGATVGAMVATLGTRPADLVVAFGPSIGPCCYDVGEELIEAFAHAGVAREVDRWFSRLADGRLRLDLWAANRDQLIRAGVVAHDLHVSRLCTACHAESFHSYRVHGVSVGRMAAIVRPAPA